MTPITVLIILVTYFAILMTVGYATRDKGNSNDSFFTAKRTSPWYLVAFGMIGASVSGVSLVSVPGMAVSSQWTYLQTCLGFFVGYIIVAYILLPMYYKMGLTSIYQYLAERFGESSHKTASVFFIIAKLVSSATKLYIAVLLLHLYIFSEIGLPFWITAVCCVILIWLYTRMGGIKTIVWTDSLQTFFMILSIVVIAIESINLLDYDNAIGAIWNAPSSKVFEWDDWSSPHHFVKQFFSGIFIVIVMTGLDQDMMQKNLTCKTLKESRKNMLCYGTAFVPVNLLLFILGTAIILFSTQNGISLPDRPDSIVPWFTAQYMPTYAMLFFILGIISASFSSADSALTSITTSIAVDIFGNENVSTRRRKIIHLSVCAIFTLLVVAFNNISNKSIIDTIYTIVGYAYGPLLGLFVYGLFTKRRIRDRLTPFIAIAAPMLTFLISYLFRVWFDYRFGYELLMLNGFITFAGLYIGSIKLNK